MTPQQQKAKELVEKFLPFVKSELYQREHSEVKKRVENGEKFEDLVKEGYLDSAKQCALIACDEMIQQNGELYLNGMDGEYYRTKNAFLFDVKQEITKLT